MDTETRKKMILELRLALDGSNHFTATLIRLALKADDSNLNRLALGFPNEVAIARAWRLGQIDQQEVYPHA